MARLAHVLVIDSDPKGLRTVAFGFERDGCRVSTVSTVDAGLAAAASAHPDAVVVALRQGAQASRFIIEGLAEGLSALKVPVVALGTEEQKRALGPHNPVDFLPLPAYLRDVITITRMRAARREDDGKDPLVQGALSEYGLFFLIRAFATLKTSAVVQVERANRKGELRFAKGELRTAQVGTITGAPALNQMLLWEEAALEVRFRAVTARSQLNKKAADLLDDAERFLRDFTHTARTLGSAHTVYELSGGTDRPDLQAEVAPVLRLFDGQRTVADVLDESPFRVFDTLRIISRFVDTGTIQRKPGVEPKPSVSTAAASPLMEAWLRGDEARERLDTADEPANDQRSPSPVTHDEPIPAPSPRGGSTGPLPAATATEAPAEALPADINATAPPSTTTGVPPRAATGELVARSTVEDKAVKPRPSMVIDIPSELLDPAPDAFVPSAARPLEKTAPGMGDVDGDTPLGPSGAFEFAATSHGAPSGSETRSTGSMEVRTVERPQGTGRPTGSIELDPALVAELESPLSPTPAPEVHVAPHAARTVGKSVSHASATKPRAGDFDQLERDFFAREADLYKSEGPDSFDDLD
ncbi:MAG: hypothetical protein KA712_18340 [Myxococcales bacterium]|nr:hypothetical protein [Myxococcales bacterium]